MATRGRFVKVCIEMDLRKPLCPRFVLGMKSYNIEYEYIHSFCFHYGKVDHRKELCRFKAANLTSQMAQSFTLPPASNPIAVTESTPTTPTDDNSNLQQSGLEEGDKDFGP
ncbi:hypothetical protein LOK49_LG01G01350 [Camellia lanceoleosa]|uniref:Uncharacterized protein n=1 Tax=Camellia lanceoleosa TaxID=1840588 RepID=A0ACC0J006_9ERIC|nr:hypothetical protein LOK49_LG01G01350 [Camellia lanceoleosa]